LRLRCGWRHSRPIKLALVLVFALLAGLALATHAAARSAFCSPSGDLCTAAVTQGADAILRIDTFAHRGRYGLCVTAPDRSRVCKRFRLRPARGGLFRSRVLWSGHYPDKGRGIYRVRWQQFGANLGPRLSFHRGPTMHVRPRVVRAGERVRVFGSVRGCAAGNDVILLSGAFPRRREFAGVPAVFTPVRADGRYGTRIRIPRQRRPGRYRISARCGGGNLGISRTLRVQASRA
jgi:hypothetical protein